MNISKIFEAEGDGGQNDDTLFSLSDEFLEAALVLQKTLYEQLRGHLGEIFRKYSHVGWVMGICLQRLPSLLCNARLNHPHMLVNGGPRYPIALGHIPHNDTGITKQGADLPNLLPVQFRPSSPLAPSSAGCGQSRLGPLSDQVALKLGQGRKYMKNQP